METLNTRVLVIDDEQVIRDTFIEILQTKDIDCNKMNAAAMVLFDEPDLPSHKHESLLNFQVDEAINGKEGLAKVEQTVVEGNPYALIFCDMRMPGWDGLTTVQQIRKVDTKAEIVFVTAYSDYTIDTVMQSVGPNVGYHCKPFEAEEIRQIATKGVCDWSKLRDLENLIGITSELNVHNDDLNTLLKNTLQQLVNLTSNLTAMLLFHHEIPEIIFNVGDRQSLCEKIMQQLRNDNLLDCEIQRDDFLYLPMSHYGVLLLKDDKNNVIDESRTYLIRLFVQQVAKSIENIYLRQELAAKQRLSDMGQAASCVVHDLRQPLTGIMGALELARQETEVSEEIKFYYSLIEQSCDDMNEYIKETLEFTNTKKPSLDEITLSELIGSIYDIVTITLTKDNISLTCNLNGYDHQKLLIDVSQIYRALLNLINNAKDAIKDYKFPCITINTDIKEGRVIITINDNGPGVPGSIKDTLFEPFVTKNKIRGIGLGLAITKKMIENNNGSISFKTGKSGTSFIISLPLFVN